MLIRLFIAVEWLPYHAPGCGINENNIVDHQQMVGRQGRITGCSYSRNEPLVLLQRHKILPQIRIGDCFVLRYVPTM
jgi:hypothetical protein